MDEIAKAITGRLDDIAAEKGADDHPIRCSAARTTRVS